MCCHLCPYPYSTSALVRLMRWAKRLTYTFELTRGKSGRRNDLKLHTMLPCPYLLYYYEISWKKEQESSIMKHTTDTHTTFVGLSPASTDTAFGHCNCSISTMTLSHTHTTCISICTATWNQSALNQSIWGFTLGRHTSGFYTLT